ncbi:hypothetical protein H310_10579 [Aphanomyces invadans]|uniref:Uncharacterized protein n=1 Tax=Aphanomyces invadans TaxID=157072 RepID=A0A024TPL0_9STRA|nr:hypothetical protein H310_10579 [Aphanomyces invadans]ETV95914.1 hypothetical protein H310_10579 [Aphanomyces invadans]|eukprot:XP_008875225.1 hypothetical protein H310_10579 [Aphanomyces invadans]
MAKVHTTVVPARQAYPTRFNRLSLVYSTVFTLKLVITPFLAYLTEPFPWTIPPMIHPAWNATSKAEASRLTAVYLQSIYNNQTMLPTTVCYRDVTTNSNMLRLLRPVPPSASECMQYLMCLPGAGLYTEGMRELVCSFLSESEQGRARMSWQHCDHVLMAGLPMGDYCLWFEATGKPTDFMVYHALLIWEDPVLSWCKLVYRCVLATYIVRVLWRRYYSHYHVLLRNLETLGWANADRGGTAPSFSAFEVIVGDPTYMVLSDPFVSIAMMTDIWMGLPYLAIATERTSQITDVWNFVLGCMYSARYVWAGYLMMWIVSKVVQRHGWERSFQPVEPAHMAMLAYMYGGPLVLLMNNSALMVPIHALIDLSVHDREGMFDAIPGCIYWTTIMAVVPVVTSTSWKLWRRCRRVRGTAHDLQATSLCRRRYCPRLYNDWKSRCVLAVALRRVPRTVRVEGGRLYSFLEHQPRFRRMPLFSHRGADSIVLAFVADRTVARQFRLTFRGCLALDGSTAVDVEGITACATAVPATFCTLSSVKCPSCPPTPFEGPHRLYLHKGANDCQWMLYPDGNAPREVAQE